MSEKLKVVIFGTIAILALAIEFPSISGFIAIIGVFIVAVLTWLAPMAPD